MQKRNYTKLESIKDEILEMRASGWSNSEAANHFGLKVRQIENLINRHNRHKKQLAQGVLPKPKGRPGKETPEAELERLRMENNLLRDFLQFKERGVRPRVKYYVIHMNRERYPAAVMCRFFGVSRSGYYDYVHHERIQLKTGVAPLSLRHSA